MNQFIKFIGVGGVNTLITYALYLILLQLINYQVSYTISYIFGIGLSYWLNLKYVFEESSSKMKMGLFPLVYLVQYVLGIVILYISIDKFNISEVIAPILVILISIPVTFLLSKLILTTKVKHHEK